MANELRKPLKKRISYQFPLVKEFGNEWIYHPLGGGISTSLFPKAFVPKTREWMGISGMNDIEIKTIFWRNALITYIPNTTQHQRALVAIYCGKDANGEPQLDLSEESVIAWEIERIGEETTVRPLVAGYQLRGEGTYRLATFNDDGTICCDGRLYENINDFEKNFKSYCLSLEDFDSK